MKNTPLTLLLAVAVLLAGCAPGVQAAQASDPKSACPISQPDPETKLFGPPVGLQVFIANDGIWDDLPQGVTDEIPPDKAGFVNKIFWKFPGYD